MPTEANAASTSFAISTPRSNTLKMGTVAGKAISIGSSTACSTFFAPVKIALNTPPNFERKLMVSPLTKKVADFLFFFNWRDVHHRERDIMESDVTFFFDLAHSRTDTVEVPA